MDAYPKNLTRPPLGGAYPLPAVKQRGTETIIPYQCNANGAGYMALDEPIPAGDNNIGNVDALVADGADVTQGAKADAAYAGTGDGTVISILKGVFGRIGTKIDELKTGIVLAASSNIIGKVKLTDGTHEADINEDGSLDTFINNWPSTYACTQSGAWSVNVSNFPATQAVSGTVATTVADGANVSQGAVADAAYAGSGNATTISGLKGIYAKLEAIRAVLAGTVTVSVSGVPHVVVDSGAATVSDTVAVSNFPSSTQVSNFPATQPVSATVKKLLVQKPGSSVLVEWTDGISAPTATTLRYVTQRYDLCGADQVPLAGDYLIQAYAEWANGAVHHGDIFVLPVLEPLPCVR
jgi:hypothetical protein